MRIFPKRRVCLSLKYQGYSEAWEMDCGYKSLWQTFSFEREGVSYFWRTRSQKKTAPTLRSLEKGVQVKISAALEEKVGERIRLSAVWLRREVKDTSQKKVDEYLADLEYERDLKAEAEERRKKFEKELPEGYEDLLVVLGDLRFEMVRAQEYFKLVEGKRLEMLASHYEVESLMEAHWDCPDSVSGKCLYEVEEVDGQENKHCFCMICGLPEDRR